MEKGKHSLINIIKNVKSEYFDSFKIYSKVKYILKFSYPIWSESTINSDRLQDFKQKHQELKAAVAEELGLKLLTSAVDWRETNTSQETGCVNNAEDVGGPEVENTVKTMNEDCAATILANDSLDQTQHEDSDSTTSEAVEGPVNGVAEVSPANNTADSTESAEENGKVNGALNSPPVLKSKGTWADVVSNSVAATSKADKDKQVNKVKNNIAASGGLKD